MKTAVIWGNHVFIRVSSVFSHSLMIFPQKDSKSIASPLNQNNLLSFTLYSLVSNKSRGSLRPRRYLKKMTTNCFTIGWYSFVKDHSYLRFHELFNDSNVPSKYANWRNISSSRLIRMRLANAPSETISKPLWAWTT